MGISGRVTTANTRTVLYGQDYLFCLPEDLYTRLRVFTPPTDLSTENCSEERRKTNPIAMTSSGCPNTKKGKEMSTFAEQVAAYAEAGARGFWTTTQEEARLSVELGVLGQRKSVQMYRWSPVSVPFDLTNGTALTDDFETSVVPLPNFVKWLTEFKFQSSKKVPPHGIVIPNAHMILKEGLLRFVQEDLLYGQKKRLWFGLSHMSQPPAELSRLLIPVAFGLPPSEVLAEYLSDHYPKEEAHGLASAAVGLTVHEALVAVHMAAKKTKSIEERVTHVWDSKAKFFATRGLAKICIPTESFKDVGGCYHFKKWFTRLKPSFSPEAMARGLGPKGVLFVGPFGVAKSLLSRALASELGYRYLEWDTGKLMDMYVGNTEHLTDEMLELSLLHKPCVVRIEEVAHQMSGHESSGVTDSGVMSRMIGKILTFMEEQSEGLFFVMSTNEPWRLPPAFTRSGRLDGIWKLSLPDEDALEEILQIHLRKICPELLDSTTDYGSLVTKCHTSRFSGAEVRQVIIEAARASFPKSPTIGDLHSIADEIIPSYKTQHELVERIETWANTKARKA